MNEWMNSIVFVWICIKCFESVFFLWKKTYVYFVCFDDDDDKFNCSHRLPVMIIFFFHIFNIFIIKLFLLEHIYGVLPISTWKKLMTNKIWKGEWKEKISFHPYFIVENFPTFCYYFSYFVSIVDSRVW